MKRGATRLREFDYAAREREKVRKAAASRLGGDAYGKLWSIVDGSVSDAFKNHSDYLTEKGRRSARNSIVKRVTGTVIGFANQAASAEQSAKGRSDPAETTDGDCTAVASASVSKSADAGAGAVSTSAPSIHRTRIRCSSIRLKLRIGPQTDSARKAKIITTAALMRSVARAAR